MKTYLIISLIIAIVAWVSNSIIRATIGFHEGFWMDAFAWFIAISMLNLGIAFFISLFKPL